MGLKTIISLIGAFMSVYASLLVTVPDISEFRVSLQNSQMTVRGHSKSMLQQNCIFHASFFSHVTLGYFSGEPNVLHMAIDTMWKQNQ